MRGGVGIIVSRWVGMGWFRCSCMLKLVLLGLPGGARCRGITQLLRILATFGLHWGNGSWLIWFCLWWFSTCSLQILLYMSFTCFWILSEYLHKHNINIHLLVFCLQLPHIYCKNAPYLCRIICIDSWCPCRQRGLVKRTRPRRQVLVRNSCGL